MRRGRLWRAWRLGLVYASEALHLAIVAGPFIWLPGTLIVMTSAARLGWVSEETAGYINDWAIIVCLVLWLPASPLVRVVLALTVGGLWDLFIGARNLLRRRR